MADGTRKLALTKAGNFTAAVTILDDGGRGLYTVTSPNQSGDHTSQLPFVIGDELTGGNLEIGGGINMKVTGRHPNNGPSIRQTNGGTKLTGGSILDVTPGGFKLINGWFTTVVNADWTRADLEGNLEITPSSTLSDTSVRFERLAPDYCGTFRVKGNVNWTGGSYKPVIGVNAFGGTKACLWHATGAFTVGANVWIAPFDWDTFGTIAAGMKWTILKGDNGVGPALPPSNNPNYGLAKVVTGQTAVWELTKL
ncbi:MAG: hypothetical protein K2X82_23910 [Gemmataceae bacterium]|nr:hypothetical protein [Gemmataceae bacterium]